MTDSAGLEWETPDWVRRGISRLEFDYMVREAAEARACFLECGAPTWMHHVRMLDGKVQTAVEPMEAAERERLMAAQTELAAAWVAKGTTLYAAEAIPEIDRLHREIRAIRGRSLRVLVRRLERWMDVAAHVFGNLHWRGALEESWPKKFAELTGFAETDAWVLVAGTDHVTKRLTIQLRALAASAQSNASLRAAVAARDLEAIESVDDFARLFRAVIKRHGRRTGFGFGSWGVNFRTPTWGMRPEVVLGIVDSYARHDLGKLADAADGAVRAREEMLERVRRTLDADAERAARFEAAYARALLEVRYQEDSNDLMEQQTIGTRREAIDAVGRELLRLGAIDKSDHVFQLSLVTLRAAADGQIPLAALRGLVEDGKAELMRQREPESTGDPAAPEESPGWPLKGVSASPGRATGRARIIGPQAEPPDLEPGDVLVAASAGPAWTPVLPVVTAVVLDGDAPGQHAAINCREYGIPCVVQAKFATKLIKDGELITVDGTAATVERA